MRSAAVATAAIFSLTVAISGCGGSGANGGADHPSTNPFADHRTKAQRTADRQLAHHALFRLSDFPHGWTSTASSNGTTNSKKADSQLAACLHVPKAFLGTSSSNDGSVDSPDFDSPTNQEVSNSVMVGPTTQAVETVFSILQQHNATACFRDYLDQLIKSSMRHDKTASGIQLGRLSLGLLQLPRYADDSLAYRATQPLTTQGIHAEVDVDILFIRHSRAASFVLFVNIFRPFPLNDEEHYAQIAARRLSALAV